MSLALFAFGFMAGAALAVGLIFFGYCIGEREMPHG